MALTVESEQRLERAGLVAFFAQSTLTWCGLAQQSFEFLARNFPAGRVVHPDDAAKALLPLIEVNDSLAAYLSSNKLKQKYWLTDFCNLIIDRCWAQLKTRPAPAGKSK